VKTLRQIPIADHLWEALERMAEEMGADRETLVNQALHGLAQRHGYVLPGAPGGAPEDPARREVAERVLEKAAALEREIEDPARIEAPPPPLPGEGGAAALYLVGEDGERNRVAKDRFVIGRGKHCDKVIDSSKVSREHAAIVREGESYFIEDLGSSNGTWFDRARVQRRRIQDGDEYFICSERIRCVLR
jgi:hypothetical protein